MAVAAAEVSYARPPETEIYGRSLSTVYRLGSLMVGKTVAEVVHSPEAEQARAEFYTSVEEGFGTDKELGGGLVVRDFDSRPVVDGKVMSKDRKTAVSDMTEAGLVCAIETRKKDKRFAPQLTRSKWDHENALIVDKMTRGETAYNTRIVISPFPEEAAEQTGNDYWQNIGYVPHLKRGFVQLYHVNGEGIVAGSLSFDGSDKEQLREVIGRFGIEIPDSEITDNWLKYAITATMSEPDAKALAADIADHAGDPAYKKTTNTVDVTSQHRELMDKVFNDSYIHACESLKSGFQTPAMRQLVLRLADQAHQYNDRFAQSLYTMRTEDAKFTEDDMVVVHELLVYSTIEMMRDLHMTRTEPNYKHVVHQANTWIDPAHLQELNAEAFQSALSNFAANGARNNRTYSACGLAISLGGQAELLEDGQSGPQTAFGGNLSREQLSWHGGKISKGKCVNCKKETKVGVKNWCKSCIKC